MKDNISIKDRDGDIVLDFYKRKKFLYRDYDEFEKFILGVEAMVRKSPRYARYVGYLRNEKGMNHCAIMGKMNPDSIELEMHHGPMFNLYDICDILTRYYINKGYDNLNTFFIARCVLDEHELDNIQIVSMAKMIHQSGVHAGHIFLHIKSAFGRIDRFIQKYESGMTEDHIGSALFYLDMCKEYKDNIDNGLLDVAKELKSFKLDCFK